MEVNKYTLEGKYLGTFETKKNTKNGLRGFNFRLIVNCCNKHFFKSKTGFLWRFNNRFFPIEKDISVPVTIPKKINQYSARGEYIKTFDTVRDAVLATRVPDMEIRNCCYRKGRYSKSIYLWRYDIDSPVGKDIQPRNSRNFNKTILEKKEIRLNQYTSLGEYVRTVDSIFEIESHNTVVRSQIIDCCQKLNRSILVLDYLWRFTDDFLNKDDLYITAEDIKQRDIEQTNIEQTNIKQKFSKLNHKESLPNSKNRKIVISYIGKNGKRNRICFAKNINEAAFMSRKSISCVTYHCVTNLSQTNLVDLGQRLTFEFADNYYKAIARKVLTETKVAS